MASGTNPVLIHATEDVPLSARDKPQGIAGHSSVNVKFIKMQYMWEMFIEVQEQETTEQAISDH